MTQPETWKACYMILSTWNFTLHCCNHTFLSNHPGAIHQIIQIVPVKKSKHEKWIEYILSPKQQRCLFFCVWPSSMVMIQIWKDPFQAFPSTPLSPAARLIFGGAVRPQTIFSALFLWDSSKDMSIGPDLLVKVSVSQDFRFFFFDHTVLTCRWPDTLSWTALSQTTVAVWDIIDPNNCLRHHWVN